jgi:hypothetical protein
MKEVGNPSFIGIVKHSLNFIKYLAMKAYREMKV